MENRLLNLVSLDILRDDQRRANSLHSSHEGLSRFEGIAEGGMDEEDDGPEQATAGHKIDPDGSLPGLDVKLLPHQVKASNGCRAVNLVLRKRGRGSQGRDLSGSHGAWAKPAADHLPHHEQPEASKR